MIDFLTTVMRHGAYHTCVSESGHRRLRLVQRVVWVLTTAVTLNACELCMTTQCRGRPLLPSQEVMLGGHSSIQIPRIEDQLSNDCSPQVRSATPVSHIESEGDYEQTATFHNSLLDVVRDDASHPLYSLVSLVGDLIEAYESDREPL